MNAELGLLCSCGKKPNTMSERRRSRMKRQKDCAEPSINQGWDHTQIIIRSACNHLKEKENRDGDGG